MDVQFAVLASGSRGNSALIRGRGAGLLIDVGIGPRALGERLASVGASWSSIAAVVLTHTHADHVDSASFAELARRGVSLHCQEGHRQQLAHDPGFRKLDEAGLIKHYDDRPFLTSTGLRLEPIELRHDGGPTFGFRIEAPSGPNRRPVSIGYLADSGTWSEAIAEALAGVDVLGVEFNHDVAMQRSSRRPVFLIERNLSDDGHLSNEQGAELIQAVLNYSRDQPPRHVVLLHLSEQCNQPDLALRVAAEAIRAAGRSVKVHAARQSKPHPNLRVGPRRRPARPAEIIPPSRRGLGIGARPRSSSSALGFPGWDADPD